MEDTSPTTGVSAAPTALQISPEELFRLDAEVAEHVMGWELVTRDGFTDHDRILVQHDLRYHKVLVGRPFKVGAAPAGTPFDRMWKPFLPSSIPADAALVLAAMPAHGWTYMLQQGRDNKPWTASLYRPSRPWTPEAEATCETMERAICLAATRAVRIQKRDLKASVNHQA